MFTPQVAPLYKRLQMHGFSGLRGFSGVIGPNDIMSPGTSYTFTYSPTFWDNIKHPLDVDSPSAIQAGLVVAMGNYGMNTITGVSRGLFANTWAIIVVPDMQTNVQNWLDAFAAAFSDMGYSPSFVQAETGTSSSQPGGLQQVVSEAASGIGSTIAGTTGSLLKPMLPYLLIGGAIYFVILTKPKFLGFKS